MIAFPVTGRFVSLRRGHTTFKGVVETVSGCRRYGILAVRRGHKTVKITCKIADLEEVETKK